VKNKSLRGLPWTSSASSVVFTGADSAGRKGNDKMNKINWTHEGMIAMPRTVYGPTYRYSATVNGQKVWKDVPTSRTGGRARPVYLRNDRFGGMVSSSTLAGLNL
jgi:hypothetical protein